MGIPIIVMGGTGRMGSTILRLTKEAKDLELIGVVEHPQRLCSAAGLGCRVTSDVLDLLDVDKEAVIVDFTSPEASLETAAKAAERGAAHVIGTTGFSEVQKAALADFAKKAPIFWSPNMSLGIGVISEVIPQLVNLLGPDYDVEIMEIHHSRKKDSPSGTALRLAEAVLEAKDWTLEEAACYHREGIVGERPQKQIGLQTLRGGDVVGIHTVYFMGPGERIELTHHAHSRDNFAAGALRAARWLKGRSAGRLYAMKDMLFDENRNNPK